ncbi:MAG TPA: exonuclease, partial [Blastocatellia bacterium]|nr:exonuclease [Blastocatellia bacterium]
MLKNTFRHLPGIDSTTERRLWESGVYCWEDALKQQAETFPPKLARDLEDSFDRLLRLDSRYFSDALPAQDHWRIFPELRQTVAYVDIETTGLGQKAVITTIALYDGQKVHCYVQGENLSQFT